MIEVYLNGDRLQISATTTLHELLLENGYKENFFAVAMNREFVHKDSYSNIFFKSNDNIEIVMPMQGG